MRIGVLSDLHVDLNGGQAVVEGLLQAMRGSRVQAVIIAGDVSSDYLLTLKTLEEIRERSGLLTLFVPGNHDVWNESHPGITSWQAYRELQAFSGNLCRGMQALPGGWSVIGEMGWYDFAFGGCQYSQADFERMQYGERIWQDRIKAVWDRPTLDMHRLFHRRLEAQLAQLGTGAGGSPGAGASRSRKLILVTHVLPRRELTVQRPNPEWIYLNAFLGSPQYGELALSYGVRYSICGHVHYRRQLSVDGTRFICNCLGYSEEWSFSRDPAAEIEQAFFALELD